jgi:transcriptional regulator
LDRLYLHDPRHRNGDPPAIPPGTPVLNPAPTGSFYTFAKVYTPPHNRPADQGEIMRFILAHPFATLVTSDGTAPVASHLLFMVEQEDPLVLSGHMARVNPQWKSFGPGDALVIFQGPHAYVSPVHYERAAPIPTWNYVAVHAYGKPQIIEDADWQARMLHRLVAHHDASFYEKAFQDLPETFIHNKMKGIVAFSLAATRVEARFKLSQDKTEAERDKVIRHLSGSDAGEERSMADEMRRMKNGDNPNRDGRNQET